MRLAPNVCDVWAVQRQGGDTRFLLLYASEEKAGRYFGGACLDRVHYRGLKDGLRSVQEYVTGPESPASELRLFP